MKKGHLRKHVSRISFLQRLLDWCGILLVYWAAIILHGGEWGPHRVVAVLLGILLFWILAEMQNLYSSWRTNSLLDEIYTVVSIWVLVVSILLIVAFLTKTSDIFSRVVVVSWFVLVPFILGGGRIFIRLFIRYARAHGANTRKVAIVGNTANGHRVLAHLLAMPWSGLVLHGFFDDHHDATERIDIDGIAYWGGTTEKLLQLARAGEIDVVYIALALNEEQKIQSLVAQLSDTTSSVYVVPDFFVSELMHSRWSDLGGLPVVSVYETPFNGLYGWVKRLEDIVLGSLILLLISPLMGAIAIAVKITSPGCVLFKQRRYGLNGAVVEVWKFRSMSVCEDGVEVPQAKKGDSRITPLGSFLRRTSLDELPQFFNVLQGSMSIVGPRPHAVAHNEQYRKLIKGYMLRHKVKPGITGWAQVNGWRGETDTLAKMEKRVEFDLEYIQNWSVWLDLKIIWLTVFKGFIGKNAY